MIQDLQFAFRLMARERWISAIAIIALALGIGVNVIGFTLVNAAFFRGLPFEDSGRLYLLTWQRPTGRPTSRIERCTTGANSAVPLPALRDTALRR